MNEEEFVFKAIHQKRILQFSATRLGYSLLVLELVGQDATLIVTHAMQSLHVKHGIVPTLIHN